MKLKTSAVFIIIGSIASIASSLFNMISMAMMESSPFIQKWTIVTLLERLPFLLMLTGFLLLGLQFYKPAEKRKIKVPAIITACGAGISTLLLIYLFSDGGYWNRSRDVINLGLIVLCPAMITVAGILLSLKIKSFKAVAWMFFLVGSIWLLREWIQPLYWFLIDSRPVSAEIWYPILTLLGSMLSIGLIASSQTFSDAAAGSRLEETEEQPQEQDYLADELIDSSYREVEKIRSFQPYRDSNSILFWLVTFVLSMIPLVGAGFLIYWSVAKSQVKRGNWAVANAIMSMVSTLFFILFLGSGISEILPSTSVGIVLIAVIVFFGTVTGVCAYYNSRNQENISLENHAYSPVVMGWIGYSLLMAIPLVNIICLIVFAADPQNKYRQKWAQARLLFIPFGYLFYFFLLENRIFESIFGDFGRLLSRITFS